MDFGNGRKWAVKMYAGDGIPPTGLQNFCPKRVTKTLNAKHKARNHMLNLQERAQVNQARAFSKANPNWTSPLGAKAPHEPEVHGQIRRRAKALGKKVGQ